MCADKINLGNVGHPQKLDANAIDVIAQLAVREAVGSKCVDDRIGVAELIIVKGAVDAGRKISANVADLLAHLVPGVGHVRGADAVLQVNEHDGIARFRIAADEVEASNLFKLFLNTVSNLPQCLIRAGAGPQGFDHHGLDREWRVFLPAQSCVGKEAGKRRNDHQIDNEAPVAQGPLRKVEPAHCWASSSSLTFCPSRSRLTPAVTTTSPCTRPSATITRSVSKLAITTGLRATDVVSFW